jgi:hypothetical protein
VAPAPVAPAPPPARPVTPPPGAPIADEPDAAQAREAVREALRKLDSRLAGRDPCDVGELEASVNRTIAAATGTLRIAEWPRFELALATLLQRRIPRSDLLLHAVARRLGWGRDHLHPPYPAPVMAILERITSLEATATLRRTDRAASRALDVLAAPLPPDRPAVRWLYGFENAGAVRILLGEVLPLHPYLKLQIDEATYRWWVAYLRRPHVGQGTAILGGVVSAYALAGVALWARLDPATGVPAPALAVAILCGPAIVLGWFGFVQWPRHLLRGDATVATTLARRYGWIPVTLGLLLVSAWLPDRPAWAVAVALMGLLCSVWASVWALPALPYRLRGRLRYCAGLVLRHPFMALWAIIIGATTPWALAAASIATVAVAIVGESAFSAGFQQMARIPRGALIGALVGICVGIAGILWNSLAESVPFEPLVVLVGAMALLSRAVPGRLSLGAPNSTRVWYYVPIVMFQAVGAISNALSNTAPGEHVLARWLAALMLLATVAGLWMNRRNRDA